MAASLETDLLRVCRFCGLVAHTEQDLKLFTKRKRGLHGRDNCCKKCESDRRCRTTEFIKIFKKRSPDGTLRCHFCEQEILKLTGRDGGSLSIHSLDGNHQNWLPENKTSTHRSCHVSYHQTGERNSRWAGDDISNRAKYQREWERRNRRRVQFVPVEEEHYKKALRKQQRE